MALIGSSEDTPKTKGAGFIIFFTRFECNFSSSPLVSSVLLELLSLIGGGPTKTPEERSEGQTSSPLVWSVVSHFLHSFRVYFKRRFQNHLDLPKKVRKFSLNVPHSFRV